jgi:hypothetical protein
LSALGNVINALTEIGRDHIPYRDSKLTYLLQDSLGGNSKTVIIATVNPALNTFYETIGTLKFAKRAKQIKNEPKINKNESIATLLTTIEHLRKKIQILEEGSLKSEPIPTFFENRIIYLENELLSERTRNKNLLELYEKQRKLCLDISKEWNI